MATGESTGQHQQYHQRPTWKQRIRWRLYWLIFDWEKNDIKYKALISAAIIWFLDTFFFTGLIGNIAVAVVLGIYAIYSLVPYGLTVLGLTDRGDVIQLTPLQAAIRRILSLLFADIPESINSLIEFIFGD